MKLNKEQITFALVLLVVGYLAFDALSSDGSKSSGKKSGRSGRRFSEVEPDFTVLSHAHVAGDESTWNTGAHNIFRAPTEESPLPPLDLPAPPRPALPIAPPASLPGVDAFNRVGLVADVVKVEGVELPPRVEAEEPAEEEEEDEAVASTDTEEEEAVEEGVDEKQDMRVLNLRKRLEEDRLKRIAKEQEKREAMREEEERRKTLDKIHWLNGQTWYGVIVNDAELPAGAKGLDKYDIKLAIDRIRLNTEMAEAERKSALEHKDMHVRFRRDSDGRLSGRQTFDAVNIQSIDFAAGPVNAFQLARRTTPKTDSKRHLELVNGLMKDGENELAKRHAEWMLDNGHTSRDVYVALAEAGRKSFDIDAQMRALNEGLDQYANDADLMAQRGELYSRLGLYTLADDSFSSASGLAPRNVRVNALRGAHILKRGLTHRVDGAMAVQALDRAQGGRFEITADKNRVWLDLGEANLAVGNTSEASRCFTRVNENAPTNVDALVGLGACSYSRGDFATARSRFEEALQIDPLDGRAWFNLALSSLAEGRWTAARDQFYDAMSADPFLTAQCHAALGYLYERIAGPQQALLSYQAAQQADRHDPEILMLVGRGHLLTGNFEAAYETLMRSLEMRPEQYDVLAGLAEATFLQGRFAESLRYTDAALALAKRSDTLLVRRAQTLAKLNRFDEAKKCLDQARQIEDSIEVELSLAWYYYSEGNHQEALKRFRTVVKNLDRKDDSPIAQYARRFAEEIEDNLAKTVWNDQFNRVASVKDLSRGWESYARSGVTVSLVKNRVSVTGTQRESDVPSCLFQQRKGGEFVSFEAKLFCERTGRFTAGVGLFNFRKSTKAQNPYVDKFSNNIAYEGLILAKTPEGRIAYRTISKYEMSRWETIPDAAWPDMKDGEPQGIKLGLTVQDPKKGIFALTVDGRVVKEGIKLARLTRGAKNIQLWVFTQAEIEKKVDLKVDDVRIVRRKYKEVP